MARLLVVSLYIAYLSCAIYMTISIGKSPLATINNMMTIGLNFVIAGYCAVEYCISARSNIFLLVSTVTQQAILGHYNIQLLLCCTIQTAIATMLYVSRSKHDPHTTHHNSIAHGDSIIHHSSEQHNSTIRDNAETHTKQATTGNPINYNESISKNISDADKDLIRQIRVDPSELLEGMLGKSSLEIMHTPPVNLKDYCLVSVDTIEDSFIIRRSDIRRLNMAIVKDITDVNFDDILFYVADMNNKEYQFKLD